MEHIDLPSLLVLGLVSEAPRHAYEVEACIEERRLREWTDIGFSSIYKLLARLERRGLVVSQRATVGRRPARKVYRPTAAGSEALAAGIEKLLSEPTRHRSAVSVAVMLSMSSPRRAAVRASLLRLAVAAERNAAELDARERQAAAQWRDPTLAALFDHDRSLLLAEAAWARRTAERLSRPRSRRSR